MLAKQIVKDKFWIVEENGEKIATIQMTENGSVTLVGKDYERKQFPSIKMLRSQYNITFDNTKIKKKNITNDHTVYGFPTEFKPYNQLLNLSKKLPVFTRTSKSKSFYCAGYYIIKFTNCYVAAYCPKLITLNRYEFKGPFKDKAEMTEQLVVSNTRYSG